MTSYICCLHSYRMMSTLYTCPSFGRGELARHTERSNLRGMHDRRSLAAVHLLLLRQVPGACHLLVPGDALAGLRPDGGMVPQNPAPWCLRRVSNIAGNCVNDAKRARHSIGMSMLHSFHIHGHARRRYLLLLWLGVVAPSSAARVPGSRRQKCTSSCVTCREAW